MERKSIWLNREPKKQRKYPLLDKNIKTDITIIGAGITGLTTAYKLRNTGKKICIVEREGISLGTSGFSTGNLYVPLQDLYTSILKKYNFNTAKTIADSRREAINTIENIVKAHDIDCNFMRRPLYMFTNDNKKTGLIEEEALILNKLGEDAYIVNALPIDIGFKKACIVRNQARFNPFAYLEALASIIEKSSNISIFEHTPVINIQEDENHKILTTPEGTITTSKLLIATHSYIGINKYNALTYPYRSYAISAEYTSSTKKENSRLYSNGFNANCWDMDNGFAISTHNVNSENIDTIILSGSNHKTGQPAYGKPLSRSFDDHKTHSVDVRKYLKSRFGIDNTNAAWSAQHYKTADHIPYIGQLSSKIWAGNAGGTYIATGYSTDGLTYGTVAAGIISDLMLDIKNTYAPAYSLSRSSFFKGLGTAVAENINVFCQYLKGFFTLFAKVKKESIDSLAKGEGKIITNKDGKKIATYINEQGKAYMVSAICTHAYGVLKWNEVEKTWDCPCHGSRFDVEGKVIEGPAIKPLKKYV